jgi:hypothetical protein
MVLHKAPLGAGSGRVNVPYSSSLRPRALSFLTALLLACAGAAQATDLYSGGQLDIPSVTIGGATYSNVVVTAGSILGLAGGTPNGSEDSYNPANNELTIPSVLVGSTTYTNVLITVGSLVSIGSVSGADIYDGTYLHIPSVQVGGALYSNAVVTIGGIFSAGGKLPTNVRDVYDLATGRLTIAAIQLGSTVYTNAVISVGRIVSVAGLTGIAAAGAPIAGSLVTLKDAAGHSATTTTGADGSFALGLAGLTPPFLLAVPGAGTTLYSYAAGSGVANLNPYTTVALQSYYAAQGSSVGAVFGGALNAASFPAASQLALLTQPFATLLQPYLANAGASQSQPFNPFTVPFTANHTGFDMVLDRTVLNSGALSLHVDNGSGSTAGPLSSTASVQVTPGNSTTLAAVAVNTTTANSATGATSTSQQAVPTGINVAQQTALANAQAGVLQLFSNLGQLVAAKGSALAAGDLAPYIDSNFLDQGANAAAWATQLVGHFGTLPAGTTISASILRVNRFDFTNNTLDVTVNLVFTNGTTISAQNILDENDNAGYGMVYRQEAGGGWAFYGQQSLFDAHVNAYIQRYYNANTGTPNSPQQSQNMQAQVSVPPGALSGAVVSGPADSLPDCTQNPPVFTQSSVTLALDSGLYNGDNRYDLPQQCQGSLSGTPPAGTLYTFSLTETGTGTIVQQTYPLNSVTLDFGDITQINGQSRATFAANNTVGGVAGTTLAVGFSGPTTFPVLYSYLNGFCQNASQVVSGGGSDFNNNAANIAPGIGNGTIAIPAQCGGAAMVSLTIGVSFVGINGESAQVQQQILD